MSQYHVLIPSAGRGSRMQSSRPKQYLPLNGEPLLKHVIQTFESFAAITSISVVIAEDDQDWQPALLAGCQKTRVLLCGGATRAESVLNGLRALNAQVQARDWILVHDAARPGIDHEMLLRLIDSVGDDDTGAILALPLADTLKRAGTQTTIAETIPRNHLWQAQTPQMFRYAELQSALSHSIEKQPTDEAQAMEWMGHHPKLVQGSLKNMKVTYPDDLQVVAALMQMSLS
ncbi:2-C-methyl-D-erythritol 4-phosphate cytidylyltransferase [Methylophilus sp. YYY-1]|uniref:2-C-methyl-D-erythritol 4-phosphate cytidylyltransferase n=1 Tax=Methylophilus sp. YYY-1 TaxID=2682087 RepID=UPI0023B326B2|nr:2-C-methyl-D-erythritol 4-phosphate cytidylyltransferase [Methylophilus sp. YYY-1]MDF0378850.1 2-C-methyl-D-erythritol 4-phosphate cytidylyltransferase [Methylophilus sp. YYY-1]